MKQIRGSQLNPNNVQLECIRVPKVYDWVFDALSPDTNVTVPPECAVAIAAAVAEGRTPLTVECEAPTVGGFFPLDHTPDPTGNVSCVVSANIVRNDDLAEGLGIIKVIITVRPLITVMDDTGATICSFRPTISTSRQLVVCIPEELTNDNAMCRVISLGCDVNYNEFANPDLGLQVTLDICFDVQIEAEVKLEIEGKFCFPRANDIEIPTNGFCPPFEYPQQCPTVFPEPNCECQGDVSAMDTNVAITVGGTPTTNPLNTATINATICDNCNLDYSSLVFNFLDQRVLVDPTLNRSFMFVADPNEFEPETFVCTPTTLTVSGEGTFMPTVGADDPNATFTLLLDAAANEYTFTVTSTSGVYAIGPVMVEEDELTVTNCVTFDEINNG
ncbi:hypothetical protein FZC79_07895 [Rossellomorea vietnamensis]|uniref:Uncharacterized protein n=1 Tax=Rossellomorea vietnamensis TaxID=218284 RepID=A0A5D4KGL1_9BACI|nr:hypothetical protein [Rossellomorea vietnamensis]TYR76066.1 hypothetical protein FZC79_07895 [Rossellomorea vietnamensis]